MEQDGIKPTTRKTLELELERLYRNADYMYQKQERYIQGEDSWTKEDRRKLDAVYCHITALENRLATMSDNYDLYYDLCR